jgi:hypothetical protein
VPHLHQQQATRFELRRRFFDDASHEIEPVASPGEAERRFVPVLGR